jgi:hypothetical protein
MSVWYGVKISVAGFGVYKMPDAMIESVRVYLTESRTRRPAGESVVKYDRRQRVCVTRGRETTKKMQEAQGRSTMQALLRGTRKGNGKLQTDRGYLAKGRNPGPVVLASAFVGLAQLETRNKSDGDSKSS